MVNHNKPFGTVS